MTIHAKHSFISTPSCHHAERISCETTWSSKLQSVWPRHHWRMLLHPCTTSSCSIEFLSHITFTRIGSAFSCPHKECLLTRPVTRGREAPLKNFSPPLEKCVGHSLKLLDTVQKFGPLSENSSPLLVSQADYGPASHPPARSQVQPAPAPKVRKLATRAD